MSYLTEHIDWTYDKCPKVGEGFDWEEITNSYDWIAALKGVPQDSVHHAEGDVHVHTRMVLEELIKDKNWQDLSNTYRSTIFLATLMHDIGKPKCTKKEGGRITSPHHAQVGAKMARSILYKGKLGQIPFQLREYIVQLVRHHGLPLWFWDKPEPEKKLLNLSQQIALSHLAILATADVKGRICEDLEDLLSRIDLFKETAEENKALYQPYDFQDGLARFNYTSKKNVSPTYVPYDDTTFKVFILSGLPGSGKNTWIAQNLPNLPVICLDDIRRDLKISPKGNQGKVLQAAREQAKVYLRKRQSFVWNATNLFKQFRTPLIELCATYKAWVRLIYLEVSYKTLLQRNKTRQHPLPTKKIDWYIERMEVPTLEEAHEVIYEIV